LFETADITVSPPPPTPAWIPAEFNQPPSFSLGSLLHYFTGSLASSIKI
jgi:hypothetical protein